MNGFKSYFEPLAVFSCKNTKKMQVKRFEPMELFEGACGGQKPLGGIVRVVKTL
jgi:hypothetical protein